MNTITGVSRIRHTSTDCAGKLWLAGRLYPAARGAAATLAGPALAAGAALVAVALAPGDAWAGILGTAGLGACAAVLLRALSPEERRALRQPRTLLRMA